MRTGLVLTALLLPPLLLPLGGCVVPPDQAYYAPAGYGYPGYAYGAPGYAYSGYAGGDVYPGYAYNGGGSPTLAIEGATVPLIFLWRQLGLLGRLSQLAPRARTGSIGN